MVEEGRALSVGCSDEEWKDEQRAQGVVQG